MTAKSNISFISWAENKLLQNYWIIGGHYCTFSNCGKKSRWPV